MPVRRGEVASPDDYLTDAELRQRELTKLAAKRADLEAKRHKLRNLEEAREKLAQANALTRLDGNEVAEILSTTHDSGATHDEGGRDAG